MSDHSTGAIYAGLILIGVGFAIGICIGFAVGWQVFG